MAKKPTENAGFTDTKRVKELIALMAENGLAELELVDDKRRILLRRGTSTAAAPVAGQLPITNYQLPAPPAPQSSPAPQPSAPPSTAEKLLTINSPMVGTYYAAPSPDASAYVSVGSAVDEKTVVCIIEAMKVFNPIPAEVSGTIVKILATNGQVVEYGQPLFEVKP